MSRPSSSSARRIALAACIAIASMLLVPASGQAISIQSVRAGHRDRDQPDAAVQRALRRRHVLRVLPVSQRGGQLRPDGGARRCGHLLRQLRAGQPDRCSRDGHERRSASSRHDRVRRHKRRVRRRQRAARHPVGALRHRRGLLPHRPRRAQPRRRRDDRHLSVRRLLPAELRQRIWLLRRPVGRHLLLPTFNNSPAGRIEGFVPISPGSSYYEDYYYTSSSRSPARLARSGLSVPRGQSVISRRAG